MMPITFDFPKRMLSNIGLCDGHVYWHEPHSMHEVMHSASTLSHICFAEAVASKYGSSPMGHTLTHFAHLMHGSAGLRLASLSLITVTLFVPLHTGTSTEVSALPIIGPPAKSLLSPSGMPPQRSMSSLIGVPMRTRKLPGWARRLPVTVV